MNTETLETLKHKDIFYFKSDKDKKPYEVVGDYLKNHFHNTRFICLVSGNNLKSHSVKAKVVKIK